MSKESKAPVIVWFRQDLRLGDNPALTAAAGTGQPILPVFLRDDSAAGDWAPGAASRWWLHHSLKALDESLGGTLCLLQGNTEDVLLNLVREIGATDVFVNRCIEPWQSSLDAKVATALGGAGVPMHASHASTLFDPDAVRKADGTPYRVFTPFYRKGCLENAEPPREPLPAPGGWPGYAFDGGLELDALGLMPTIAWYHGMAQAWKAGESAGLKRLDAFLDEGLKGYQEGRNRPDLPHVSRLSPHLHFGEVSPHQIWHAVMPLLADSVLDADAEAFMRELGWREFSAYLLWHWPTLPEENLQSRFDRFPWLSDKSLLARWQQGRTGYPIVDAGMRELWQTGYMHNRVRMIVGSFLVKNLLHHWRDGEAWFWDTLVDADLANNSSGWQWIAGSGADAAPYFRIFNPVNQGKKFDPDGTYVRRFLPELGELDTCDIHSPWESSQVRRRSLDYPEPVVELGASRQRALEAFRSITQA